MGYNTRSRQEYEKKKAGEGWRSFTLRLSPSIALLLDRLSVREFRNYRGVVEASLVEHAERAAPGLMASIEAEVNG